jgi:hypothetical protein
MTEQTCALTGKKYVEVTIDTPTIFTPAAALTSERLYNQPYKYVFSFIIRVRTMGTATYIRLGGEYGQNYSLTVVGQTYQWSGNPGQVVDMAKLWCISDTNDAVLEIVADYVPVYQTMAVNEVIGRAI